MLLTQCGLPLMDERMKQSIDSAREAMTFLKKRAALEEEYGHGIKKLTRASLSDYSSNENRAGYVLSCNPVPMARVGVTCSRTRTR